MLQALHIENYALIGELDFLPSMNGLNIITGETGAGKSIMIGALGLILGERADSTVLRDKDRKCIVEAKFDISRLDSLRSQLLDEDLDDLNPTIIRREINPAGRSRAFINDTPVALQVLKSIGEQLVDVHSQHQNIKLNEKEFQFRILDAFAGASEKLNVYRDRFAKLDDLKKELETLEKSKRAFEQEMDYKSFLFDELEKAELDGLDPEQMEQDLLRLENAEEIKQTSSSGYGLLEAGEHSISDQLASLLMEIGRLTDAHSGLSSIHSSLNSVLVEIRELANELREIADSSEVDPEQIDQLNERMHAYRNLLHKHRANDIDSLKEIRDTLDEELQKMSHSSERIEELNGLILAEESKCRELAKELHKLRVGVQNELELSWQKDLENLGMPNGRINFSLDETETLNKWGNTELQIMFSSNKGSDPEPLHKVASGGELARIMLIIKAYLARHSTLPTMILDEIDTGVSGETAKKVADMMDALAQDHQLITITHLPQIAAKGNRHFFVYKTEYDGVTHSSIKELSVDERIEEIAKMLSGANPSESARKNALELLSA